MMSTDQGTLQVHFMHGAYIFVYTYWIIVVCLAHLAAAEGQLHCIKFIVCSAQGNVAKIINARNDEVQLVDCHEKQSVWIHGQAARPCNHRNDVKIRFKFAV